MTTCSLVLSIASRTVPAVATSAPSAQRAAAARVAVPSSANVHPPSSHSPPNAPALPHATSTPSAPRTRTTVAAPAARASSEVFASRRVTVIGDPAGPGFTDRATGSAESTGVTAGE